MFQIRRNTFAVDNPVDTAVDTESEIDNRPDI